MAALVVVETIAIGLLAVLVAGLLRSHAEILRLLHHLGADYLGEDHDAALTPSLAPRRQPGTAADIGGVTPFGDALAVGVANPDASVLLLFLSTGCEKCARFVESIAAGAHRTLGARVLVVTRGPDQESVGLLRAWAERGVEIVMSSAAWDDFRVPGSPYVVLCAGGNVVGEGTAGSWGQIESLVRQADGDVEAVTGRSGLATPHAAALARAREAARQQAQSADRERRNDEELRAAGIEPGDARLYPRLPDEAA